MDASARLHCIYIQIILALLLCSSISLAQRPILERNVSFQVYQKSTEEVLNITASQGRFTFSYNPDQLPVDSMINANFSHGSVKKVLEELFGNRYSYVTRGNYLIIQPNPNHPRNKKPRERITYTITGFVVDGRTGEKIQEVTVYDANRMESVLTDASGYFSLTVSTDKEYLPIAVSKLDYLDTIIVVKPATREKIDVAIYPDTDIDKMPILPYDPDDPKNKRNVEDLPMVRVMVPEPQRTVAENIVHALENIPAQISLLPNVGTNSIISGALKNSLSINVLAGYSFGVQGLEVGGVLNIVRQDVHGVQLAGFGNIVGGRVTGLQAAGFFNNTRGTVMGAQLAGFSNVVLDTIVGIQGAGFSNVLRGHMTGGQLSGFNNLATQDVDGVQIAGFSNIALQDVNTAQISGFFNYGRTVRGVQIAGFLNVSKDTVSGTQITGFMNMGGTIKGAQVGLFNIADSVTGASIGFFSYVRKGYHKFELSTSEALHANLSFKTGTTSFYNIFGAGSRFERAGTTFAFGYGVGTQPKLGNKLALNLELLGYQLLDRRLVSGESLSTGNYLNTMGKFNAHLSFPMFNKALYVTTGASINYHIYNQGQPDTFSTLLLEPIYRVEDGPTRERLWAGGHIGIVF